MFTRFGFFDHLPPSVYIFYGIKVYKKLIFLTTYPPPLVNVVCERPPMKSLKNFLGLENGQSVDNSHLKSNNPMAFKYGHIAGVLEKKI